MILILLCMMGRFQKHSDNEPGTHPRYVSQAMEQILAAATPNLSYKVGPDSKVYIYTYI